MACHKSFSISGVRGGKNSNETLSPGFAPNSKRRLAAKALRVVMRHSPRTSFAYNDVFIYFYTLSRWAQAPLGQKFVWAMPTHKML